jgi:hypothetical protein
MVMPLNPSKNLQVDFPADLNSRCARAANLLRDLRNEGCVFNLSGEIVF